MRTKRVTVGDGRSGVYHCMTRTVNGEHLFEGREMVVLRKMIRQIADFSGVEVLTYCVMANHFHVLLRVPPALDVSDAELMRRYSVLYPMPTKYRAASVEVMRGVLRAGGLEAEVVRAGFLARMGDVSAFMKTLKQRFSVWFNKSHDRFGTLWAERFKSVLVEGHGNPLQTMAAYIDLNPVRAGLVEDPKDYRFCGYAEAVAGDVTAGRGLVGVWGDRCGLGEGAVLGEDGGASSGDLPGAGLSAGDVRALALRAHRMLIFGKGASPWTHRGRLISREDAVRVLEEERGELPMCAMLRCRVRYFTDGAILGSAEFVREYVGAWQRGHGRKRPPRVNAMKGSGWGDLSVIRGLRSRVFD